MQQLHGLDSIMALGEIPNVPMHIGALFIYRPDGVLPYERVRERLAQQIRSHLLMLQCRLSPLPFNIDKPYWVNDPHFNLDYHVRRFALPQPADWDALYQVTQQFQAEPLNHDRPLWQALVIEGLDNLEGLPPGCVALIMKIHHALADGKTAMRIFTALHSLSPEPDAPLIADRMPWPPLDFSPPNILGKYLRAYRQTRGMPQRVAMSLGLMGPSLTRRSLNMAKRWRAVARGENGRKLPRAPRSIFNGLPGPDRVIGHVRIPLAVLRDIESKTGATANDMALCVVSGAMREYLQAHHEDVSDDLVAGMPISVRARGDRALVGNHVTMSMLSLYSRIDDPLERLQVIHADTAAIKQATKGRGGKSIFGLLDEIVPGPLVWSIRRIARSPVIKYLPPVVNTVVTNVPGIRERAYLCGAELVDYLGFGFIAPTMTLFHTVSSLHDHANITFLSCRDTLPHPESYRLALQHSWQALHIAAESLAAEQLPATRAGQQPPR